MLRNKRNLLVMLALVSALPIIEAQCAETSKKVQAPQADDAVRSVLMNLESAITSKNLDNAIAPFAEDIDFIDQSGEEVRGRAAMRERFEQLFKNATAPAVGLHPQSINFPADNVALVVGEVSRKHDQEDLPASRFSMVMVKKNNSWQINEITETSMRAAQAESRLHDMDWFVGEWTAEKPDVSAQLNVEWAPGKKFITSKTTLKVKDKPTEVDTQVIGWDPQHSSIISWHFDSNGGFGSGAWTRQSKENKWTCEVMGVGADGTNTVASNVFNLKSPDEFVWQSVHRSLDGAPVSDTEAITVHRVKH